MKIFLVAFVLLIVVVSGAAQQKKDTFEFVKRSNSHTVRLVFKTRPFVRDNHKVEMGKAGTKVDDCFALGTDGNAPRTESASVRFFFDGMEVSVPKNLYSDCFEPNLEADNFRIKFGDDGESLMAFMAGGDAAGGYQIYWILRKDGKHSRFSEPCSDCDYTGFVNGFFENELGIENEKPKAA